MAAGAGTIWGRISSISEVWLAVFRACCCGRSCAMRRGRGTRHAHCAGTASTRRGRCVGAASLLHPVRPRRDRCCGPIGLGPAGIRNGRARRPDGGELRVVRPGALLAKRPGCPRDCRAVHAAPRRRQNRGPETTKGRRGSPSLSSPAAILAVGDVHRHFEAEAHFGVGGLGPHGDCPFRSFRGGGQPW